MKGSHILEASGHGTTNRLYLEATGIIGVLMWPILAPAIRRALAQENAGLKSHCEALAAQGGPDAGAA